MYFNGTDILGGETSCAQKASGGYQERPGLFAPSRGTQGKKSVLDNP